MSRQRRQESRSTGCAASGRCRCDPGGLLERWIGGLLASSLAFGLATAVAQTASSEPALVDRGASAIPVTEILKRAEEDQERAQNARRLLSGAEPTARLRTALDSIAEPVEVESRVTNVNTLRDLPVTRLESLSRHWRFDARRLQSWQTDARRSFAPYAQAAAGLQLQRPAWSATRAAGLLDTLPPALSVRVNAILDEIDATENALSEELGRQFELTQRANDLQSRIQSGSAEVATAIEDIDSRLLKLDMPPLWQGWGALDDSQSTSEARDRGLEIEQQFAVDYRTAGGGNRQALLAVQVVLLPFIAWLALRGRRAGWPANPLAPKTFRLRRPISCWVLLSMLAVLLLEQDAPLLVREFALLIAVVPVIRLLPAGLLREHGFWPYVAIGLYGLDQLGAAFIVESRPYRLFLLVETSIALVLTGWMLRQMRQSGKLTPAARRIGQILGTTALAIFGISIVANVAGNVSLGEALDRGVIDSGYFALLLYAGVSAIRYISRALLGLPELAELGLVKRRGDVLHDVSMRGLFLCAAIGWLLYALDRFRVRKPLQDFSRTVFGLGLEVGEVSIHLGDVLIFALSVWLAFAVSRVVRNLLRDELGGHAGLPRGVGNSIASLTYYALLMVGFLIALSAAGFKVGQLTLVFSALGVGIGFGLQNVVNSFVSGLVLMFERPIQPGDIVDVAGMSGTVREIGLRATTIRTFDGADVVVPNGQLLNSNVTNWTMFDRSRRIEIQVSVAYGSDAASVLSLLTAAALKTEGVSAEPRAPVALLTGYGDSSLDFVMRAWTNDIGNWMNIRSAILTTVLVDLDAAGISIPYPQRDVHVKTLPEMFLNQPRGS